MCRMCMSYVYTFFQKISIFQKLNLCVFSGPQTRNLTSILSKKPSVPRFIMKMATFLNIVFLVKLHNYHKQIAIWVPFCCWALDLKEEDHGHAQMLLLTHLYWSFAQIQAFSQSHIWMDKYYNMLWNSNKISKIDFKKCWHFHGIGTDGFLEKMDVRFVISGPENSQRLTFWKIKIFWKRCKHTTVIPYCWRQHAQYFAYKSNPVERLF